MMTSLFVHLEDLVLADFGAAELAAVRAQLGSLPSLSPDAPQHVRAKQFLDALAVVQRREVDRVYVWAGSRLTGALSKEMPAVFRGHTSARTVLLQLNQVASALASALVPDATVPEFWQDFLDAATVRVGFDGPVEVAWLLEGMTLGLAGMYGERVETSRGVAPPTLLERRLVDVKVVPDRRAAARSGAGVTPAGSRG